MLLVLVAGTEMARSLLSICFVGLVIAHLGAKVLFAQTGTFLDRHDPSDLRVASYNVPWNRIFPDQYPTQAAKFERVVQTVDADIWNLQEIGPNAYLSDAIALMNEHVPLPGGAS